MRTMMGQMDAERLRQFIAQFEQVAGQVPSENQDMVEVVLKILRARLAELGGE